MFQGGERNDMEMIGMGELKILNLMQLGNFKKSSLSRDAKFKSLSARWFGCSRVKTGKDI